MDRYVLKVNPHLLSLAKCSGASSSGNGLPTKVTCSCLSGKTALSSFVGLYSNDEIFSRHFKHIKMTLHSRFTRSRQVDSAQPAYPPILVNKMSSTYPQTACRACSPVMSIGRLLIFIGETRLALKIKNELTDVC